MSDGQTGPEEKKEGAPDQTTEAAAKQARPEGEEAQAPSAEAAEKPAAEKPKAPRKRAPKATVERLPGEAAEKPAEKPAKAPAKKAEKPAAKPAKPAEKPAGKGPMKQAAKTEEDGEQKRSVFREPVVFWSLIGGAVVILLAAGYVAWTQFGPAGSKGASNPLAERSICQATLDRASAYGVIPPNTALSSPDPDKTQTDGRVTCHGEAGQMQYAITVDVVCTDMGKDSCLNLYSVKQGDGTALFQRQM